MTTLEKLAMHAAEIAEKLNRGEKVTKDELRILEMQNSLRGGKAFNAGTRKAPKGENKPQRIR